MRLIRRLFLLSFLFTIHSGAHAQDTLSLFYMTARYQLTDVHKAQIGRFLNTLDKSELDSIQIIGVADSTGNLRANERLSLRRASHVERFLKDNGFILPTRLLAKGEDPDAENDLQIQRRVDLIFYFKENQNSIANQEQILEPDTEDCFVSYDHLNVISHTSVVNKGKKNYIQIEVHTGDFADTQKLYTLHVDSDSKLPSLKKVKWKVMETGEDWARKPRFVTTVPLEDFLQHGIVKKAEISCDSVPVECGFRLSDTTFHLESSVRMVEATFLLPNVRVKRKFFRRKYYKIIAPAEYTGEESWFYDEEGKNQVFWYEKKGRRRKKNRYAEVHRDLLKNGALELYHYVNVSPCYCQFHPCNNKRFRLPCRPMNENPIISYGLEIGDRNIKPTHFGYLGLYYNYSIWGNELNLSLGMDTRAAPYVAFRYDRHFINLRPLSLWRNAQVYDAARYSIYSGTTLDFNFRKNNESMLNHDFHLGIDYMRPQHAFSVQRVFLEGGIQVNYLGDPLLFSPKFVLGLQFRF